MVACYFTSRQKWNLWELLENILISVANVASVICWNTAAVDDDAEDGEANASGDFHDAQHKLNLLIVSSVPVVGSPAAPTSPYPRTPKYWMATKATKRGVIQAALLMPSEPGQ